MSTTWHTRPAAARAVAWLAVVSSATYFVSDVLEDTNGGFTTVQLWLTLIAEATLPVFVVGLYMLSRESLGRLGRYGASAYALAYGYFTYTVIYAIGHHTPDFATLNQQLGPWMTLVGGVMVVAGVSFGAAILRSRALPRWTGVALAIGVLLVAVMIDAPSTVQLTAVGVRDVAFIGMGIGVLRPGRADSVHGVARLTRGVVPDGCVDLHWLPLGAGGHSVRWNGKAYEALAAWHEHRSPQDLYHAALEVRSDGCRYVIEMAPVWNDRSPERGVVCEGPVGARWLGRFRAFRYEVRCWPDGRIPDIAEAVESPRRISDDPTIVVEVLRIIQDVPTLTWGRDELGAGDMWNSNSLVAWLLASTGQDMTVITTPTNGRAPGWTAGLYLANHSEHSARSLHILKSSLSS
jgi:hypothetical protein